MGAISFSCKETGIIIGLHADRNLKIWKEEEEEYPRITDREGQKYRLNKTHKD